MQVAVERRYRAHVPLLCFANELRQVGANIVSNAMDAMGHCSERRLLLRVREATSPSTGKTGVRLTIADTGIGMSATTLRRLFEVFFTTKSATGTGLGLWVSAEIVKKHNGTLRVRSQQGARSGSTFSVFLPYLQS